MDNKQYEKFRNCLLATLDNPKGEIVMEELRLMFSDRSSHVPGDPHHTAFLEGQRYVYQYLRNILEENKS